MWLDKPEQWVALADALRKAGEFGFDTETYGQPDKTSPQYRARVHCWSVGVLTAGTSPRGFRHAVGRVLPVAAMEAGPLREVLEDPSIRKYAHNAPHDYHATRNHGVAIAGLEDSLQWLRVAVPGMRDYGLKGAEQWALGYGPRPEFWDMMKYMGTVTKVRSRWERACICGKRPCHAKGISEWWDEEKGWWSLHTRVEWRVFSPYEVEKEMRLQVTDFVPGAVLPPLHWNGKVLDRLAEWWNYSAADAVHGIELIDWVRNRKPRELKYPWERRPTASAGS